MTRVRFQSSYRESTDEEELNKTHWTVKYWISCETNFDIMRTLNGIGV